MKRLWHRVLGWLTPGIRGVLGLLSAACLATLIGTFSGLYDLDRWLALSGPGFWSGQFWQIITYVILPVSLVNFLINGLMIAFFGGSLERIWSRREVWFYCVLVTAGTGLAKVLFQFSLPSSLAGSAPLFFGLLAAWGFLFRNEKISLGWGGEITIGLVAFLAGIMNFALILFSAGLSNAFIMSAGGLAGLLYLWLQAKIIMARASRVVLSDRIRRLEI
jgi:membrane associated rhomboid family serine protease